MKFSISIEHSITERTVKVFFLGILMGMLAVCAQLGMRTIEQAFPSFRLPTVSLVKKITAYDETYDALSQNIQSIQYEEGSMLDLSQTDVAAAHGYILVDLDTQTILAGKNIHSKLPIASLTKIMTAAVTMDLLSPEATVTVSKGATHVIPTTIGLSAGEQLSVRDLLHATLLTSANDAAEALKDGVDIRHTNPVFVYAMNQKASLLGLTDTHFANAEGFDSPHNYSSPYDLAVLTDFILRSYPLFNEIIGQDHATLAATPTHKQYYLNNWNGLIGVYPGASGVKIGNTGDAGKTTIVLSHRNNKRLLAIVLGAGTIFDRDLWAATLLNEGYKAISGLSPIAITTQMLQRKYASWKYWN